MGALSRISTLHTLRTTIKHQTTSIMLPDSAISDNNSNNNMYNISNILSQDEIDYLLSHFQTHRNSLRCPNCERKGIFRRNGSTKPEPPQPIFRFTGCGSSFRAKTMLNIVNSTQSTPANTQTSMNPEFSGSFQGATSSQVTQTNSNKRCSYGHHRKRICLCLAVCLLFVLAEFLVRAVC